MKTTLEGRAPRASACLRSHQLPSRPASPRGFDMPFETYVVGPGATARTLFPSPSGRGIKGEGQTSSFPGVASPSAKIRPFPYQNPSTPWGIRTQPNENPKGMKLIRHSTLLIRHYQCPTRTPRAWRFPWALALGVSFDPPCLARPYCRVIDIAGSNHKLLSRRSFGTPIL
jgi:hypothetical protein